MVAALSHEGEDKPRKRIELDEKDITTKTLSNFVTINTRQFFDALDCLDIPKDFLEHHPSQWKSHSDYIRGIGRAQSLKVVNDAAEQGVSLIQSFNAIITNQEEQKQFLLQVVEKHRRDYPYPKKSTIAGCSVDN